MTIGIRLVAAALDRLVHLVLPAGPAQALDRPLEPHTTALDPRLEVVDAATGSWEDRLARGPERARKGNAAPREVEQTRAVAGDAAIGLVRDEPIVFTVAVHVGQPLNRQILRDHVGTRPGPVVHAASARISRDVVDALERRRHQLEDRLSCLRRRLGTRRGAERDRVRPDRGVVRLGETGLVEIELVGRDHGRTSDGKEARNGEERRAHPPCTAEGRVGFRAAARRRVLDARTERV